MCNLRKRSTNLQRSEKRLYLISTSLLFYRLASLNEAPAVVDPRDARRLFVSSFAVHFLFFIIEKVKPRGTEVARVYETTEPRGIARVVAKFQRSVERFFATPCETDCSDVGTLLNSKCE